MSAMGLDQLKALYTVTMEIVNQCQPCFRVKRLKLKGQKTFFDYDALDRSQLVSKCAALLHWPLADGLEVKLTEGHDWTQLQRLLDMSVPVSLIQQKLEELQVEAGKFVDQRNTWAETCLLFPNRYCLKRGRIFLPYSVASNLACNAGFSGTINLPTRAQVKAFLNFEDLDMFDREPTLTSCLENKRLYTTKDIPKDPTVPPMDQTLKYWAKEHCFIELDPNGLLLLQRLNSDGQVEKTLVAKQVDGKVAKCWTIFGQRTEPDPELLQQMLDTEPELCDLGELSTYNPIFSLLLKV